MTDLNQKYGFWEKSEKFFEKFRILRVMTDFQIDFLNDSQLFPTFGDLISIELAKGFNLRHMTILEALGVHNYYVIMKKLRQNRKFRSRKYFF